MHTPAITCKNCGNHFHGNFCNECGEKVYSQKDKAISKILDEVFHFITHLDSSFFTSVKTIFSHPGKMSDEYVSGKRKRYFKPVSLFLALVVIYLLFPYFAGLNIRFEVYLSSQYGMTWYSIPMAKQMMISHKLSEQSLAALYDSHSPVLAKAFLLSLIPMCALVLSLLFFTSKKYFFDHFILATEILSLYILAKFLLLALLAFLAEKMIPGNAVFSDGSILWRVFFILFGFYIAVAFRRFYKQAVWISILKAAIFLFVFAACIIYVYNLVLYFLVMLFI